MIRKVQLSDAQAIAEIYNYYIENTIITFELEPIDADEERFRILNITNNGYPYIVYEEQGGVIGYAYLSKWREREAYNNTLETSIYLHKDHCGKGIGKILYKALIDLAKEKKVHVLIGSISCPNSESQKLHEKLGFEKVGVFKEVGCKFDKYIDVEFWQLSLSAQITNN